MAQSELDRVTKDLADLEPKLEASKKAKAEVSDDIDRTIEETCKDIYSKILCLFNFLLCLLYNSLHSHGSQLIHSTIC